MAKKQPPPPPDYVLDWFSRYNQWAQAKGWQYLPWPPAVGMYFTTNRLIDFWEQTWPTFDELDEGLDAFAAWAKCKFSPPSSFWFLANKVVDEESKTKYPNILWVRDWGRNKTSNAAFAELPKCPRKL